MIAVALEAVRAHLAAGAPGTDAGLGEAPEGPDAVGHDPVGFLDVGEADL